MALIQCPDCQTEVSSRAPSCPKCGCPISATTVEQTGKEVKAQEGIGCLSMVAGAVLVTLAMNDVGPTTWFSAVGVGLLIFVGPFMLLCAGIKKWWRHE